MDEQTVTRASETRDESETNADHATTEQPLAVMGNFRDPNALIHAAQEVHSAGYEHFDIYTPYPVHGLDKAMGIKKTPLPFFAVGGAITGLASAVGLQWWTGTIHYPLNIGGKPFFAVWFGMPVMFELTILLCALTTAAVMFGPLCKLPRWFSPYQKDEGFRAAVDDLCVVVIDAEDRRFTVDGATSLLTKLGAENVRVVPA